MFCQEEFHLRSGGLQLASVACRFRERDRGFEVQVQEALFTPHKGSGCLQAFDTEIG